MIFRLSAINALPYYSVTVLSTTRISVCIMYYYVVANVQYTVTPVLKKFTTNSIDAYAVVCK